MEVIGSFYHCNDCADGPKLVTMYTKDGEYYYEHEGAATGPDLKNRWRPSKVRVVDGVLRITHHNLNLEHPESEITLTITSDSLQRFTDLIVRTIDSHQIEQIVLK